MEENHIIHNITRFDEAPDSETYFTNEGYLRDRPILTRTGIFEYDNGDGTIRRELRLPEDVFEKDSLLSYEGKPIIVTHRAGLINKDNVDREYIGTILTPGERYGEDKVTAKIVIHDTDALRMCGLRELSIGYSLDLVEEPGVWQGEQYDAIQKHIRVNHLALVKEARAGEDVRLNIDGKKDKTILTGGRQTQMARITQTTHNDGVVSQMELDKKLDKFLTENGATETDAADSSAKKPADAVTTPDEVEAKVAPKATAPTMGETFGAEEVESSRPGGMEKVEVEQTVDKDAAPVAETAKVPPTTAPAQQAPKTQVPQGQPMGQAQAAQAPKQTAPKDIPQQAPVPTKTQAPQGQAQAPQSQPQGQAQAPKTQAPKAQGKDLAAENEELKTIIMSLLAVTGYKPSQHDAKDVPDQPTDSFVTDADDAKPVGCGDVAMDSEDFAKTGEVDADGADKGDTDFSTKADKSSNDLDYDFGTKDDKEDKGFGDKKPQFGDSGSKSSDFGSGKSKSNDFGSDKDKDSDDFGDFGNFSDFDDLDDLDFDFGDEDDDKGFGGKTDKGSDDKSFGGNPTFSGKDEDKKPTFDRDSDDFGGCTKNPASKYQEDCGSKTNLDAADVDRIVSEKVDIGIVGRMLHLDGLERVPMREAKERVIKKANPGLWLDGLGDDYVDAAYRRTVSELKGGKKGTNYQKAQLFNADGASPFDKPVTGTQSKARATMLNKLTSHNKED